MLREPLPPVASIIGGTPSDTIHFTGFGPVLTVEDDSHPDTISATSNATPADNPRGPRLTLARHSNASLGMGSVAASKRHSSASVVTPEELTRVSIPRGVSTAHKLGDAFPSFVIASSLIASCAAQSLGVRADLAASVPRRQLPG